MKPLRMTIILLAFLLASGCAFKYAGFDNNTTYEDKARRIRWSDRDVRVSAQFSTHDAVVSQVQQTIGQTFNGTATLIKQQDEIEDTKTRETVVQDELDRLRNELEAANSVEDTVNSMISNFQSFNTKKGTPEAWGAFNANFLERFDTLQKLYQDRGFPETAGAVARMRDEIEASSEWADWKKNFGSGEELESKPEYTALWNKCWQVIAPNLTPTKTAVTEKIAARQEQEKALHARLAGLRKTRDRLLPPGETEESLAEAIREARKNASGPTAVGGVSGPAGLAVNLAKEMLDGKKSELTEAKEALGKIQELAMPALAKSAAVNAQKRAIQDLQGEYNEAVNDFLSVVSDVSAVTNYDGPGERGTIWTMSLFGARDTIQRYPNGMVKSVGPNQYRKSLGTTITEEMFRTLRVLGIPAAYVAGVVALAD